MIRHTCISPRTEQGNRRTRVKRRQDGSAKKSPCYTSPDREIRNQSVAIGCTLGRGRYSPAIGTTCQIANRYLNLPRRQTQADKYPPRNLFSGEHLGMRLAPPSKFHYISIQMCVCVCDVCKQLLIFFESLYINFDLS